MFLDDPENFWKLTHGSEPVPLMKLWFVVASKNLQEVQE
jgi:hypothetical protein